MKKSKNSGYIIAIIVITVIALVGIVSMFFVAKGIGWDAGRASAKDEYYNSRYEEGKNEGYNEGFAKGKEEGFSQGYNDPHCVYSANGQQCRLLPVGQYI